MLSNRLLIVYVIVCCVAVLANILDNNLMLLLSKPMIVPIIYLYYFVECRKVNLYFSLAMFFCFIGESAIILDMQNQLFFILIPFLLSHVLLIKLGMEDIGSFRYSMTNGFVLLVVFSMLFYVFYNLVEILSIDLISYKIPFAIYAFVLFIIGMIATYKIIDKVNMANLFYALLVICFVVSDVFFIIYSFYSRLLLLTVLNFALQMVSYFFLVKYILVKEKNLLE